MATTVVETVINEGVTEIGKKTSGAMVFVTADHNRTVSASVRLNKEQFAALLAKHSEIYFNGDKSVNFKDRIHDRTYDALVARYEKRFGEYEPVGAPPPDSAPAAVNVQSVSSSTSSSSTTTVAPVKLSDSNDNSNNNSLEDDDMELKASQKKVKLVREMPSLKKVKTEDEFQLWMRTRVPEHKDQVCISAKIDGCSGQYLNGTFTTRGDAKEGTEIPHMLPYLGMPVIPIDCLVRGEIIMFNSVFDRYYRGIAEGARTTTSGIVTSGTLQVKEVKRLKFLAYEFVPNIKDKHFTLPQYDQFKKLEDLGFTTPPYRLIPAPSATDTASIKASKAKLTSKRKASSTNQDLDEVDESKEEKKVDKVDKVAPYLTMEFLLQQIEEWRAELDYEIDGIVVSENIVGKFSGEKKPKHMMAYKSADEEYETKVIEVIWSASSGGRLIPVVSIEPVKTLTSTIRRVTGINAKNIIDNKIGPGAVVKIVKSGMVIPKIVGVINPAPKGPGLPKIAYQWLKTKHSRPALGKTGKADKALLAKEQEEMMDLGAILQDGDDDCDDDDDDTNSIVSAVNKSKLKSKKSAKAGYWIWWETSDVHFAPADGENNEQVKIKKILTFFKKVDAMHVGPSVVERIFKAGYDSLDKFFNLTAPELVHAVEGFQKRGAERVVESIQKAIKGLSIAKIADASGAFGNGIGEKKMETIFEAFPDLLTSTTTPTQMIADFKTVRGINAAAEQIAMNLEKFKKFIAMHPQITIAGADDDEKVDESTDSIDSADNKKVDAAIASSASGGATSGGAKISSQKPIGSLTGKIVVFSGFRNVALQMSIRKLGGNVGKGITKQTTYLVVDKKPGATKTEKAEKYGIEIIDVLDFKKQFNIVE